MDRERNSGWPYGFLLGSVYGSVVVALIFMFATRCRAQSPLLPPNFNAHQWAADRWAESIRRIHTWDVGVVGPNKRAMDSGAQDDMVFVRRECEAAVTAVQIAYLGALKIGNRPNHHREADGSPLGLNKSGLYIFNGRPTHPSIKLGKERQPTFEECSGWEGPDAEHWFINTLCAAYRMTGSRALQQEIDQQARLYLYSHTTTAGWGTSAWHSSRAVGWECHAVGLLVDNLEDRVLAGLVEQRLRERVERVYPAFLAPTWWDVRVDDPRIGTGPCIITWQSSVACYFLDVDGERFGIPMLREKALAQAKLLVQHAFAEHGTQWQSIYALRVDPSMPVEPATSGPDQMWLYGTPLCVATVLRHEPQHEKANEIMVQMKESALQLKDTAWLPK
jgi:hypothetical protein